MGFFYKNNLPIKVRTDLSFPESIVVELKFKRKSVFYTTLYRSPSFNHDSPEFELFLDNLNYSPDTPIVGERVKRSEGLFFKLCY